MVAKPAYSPPLAEQIRVSVLLHPLHTALPEEIYSRLAVALAYQKQATITVTDQQLLASDIAQSVQLAENRDAFLALSTEDNSQLTEKLSALLCQLQECMNCWKGDSRFSRGVSSNICPAHLALMERRRLNRQLEQQAKKGTPCLLQIR